ncbi:MAG: HAD family hydrolase [Candidatus Didemnitutus sp.]|nr:HAD family hydrolase [Candidatus Didemnitutus sp.]
MTLPCFCMRESERLHTLVFDLDDTLYPEREYVFSGFRTVDEWLVAERGVKGFIAQAEALFAAGGRGQIFDEALAALGVREDGLVGRLVAVYRGHRPAIDLPAESAAILAAARGRYRLALLSDGILEVQKRKASALGVSRWIDVQVFSDQWGREAWKPSERPFREVMRQLPGSPAGYVYIADNPRKDFIAPRALGWRTVRFRRAGGEHAAYVGSAAEAAEAEVASMADLRAWLEL